MTQIARHAQTRTGIALIAVGVSLTAAASGQYTSFESRAAHGIDDGAITPDGRLAVLRSNGSATDTRIVDLATGQQLVELQSFAMISAAGPCNDAVEVTNERAIVLGATVKVIDLTAMPPVEVAEHSMGEQPRDVSITPDGRFAIVQGGGNGASGTYVLDVSTGAILLSTPSDAPSIFVIGNDMTEATLDHGVALAFDPVSGNTEVRVVEFDPTGGGGPRFVLQPNGTNLVAGRPMDVAVSPDGRLATVRGESEVAMIRLDGSNTQFVQRFTSFPGPILPFLDTTFDSVVMNDQVSASISIGDSVVAGGYVSIHDEFGSTWFSLLDGSPRDLDISPNGEILMVHTGQNLYRFDLTALQPGGGPLPNTNRVPTPAVFSGLFAGLDSIVTRDDIAVAIYPIASGTRGRIYEVTGAAPVRIFGAVLDGLPVDVDLSSDARWAIVNSMSRYAVIDTRTLSVQLEKEIPEFINDAYPWADGAAIHPKHGAPFGFLAVNGPFGWAETVDLVSRESQSCRSLPNSTGEVASLFALGSTRVNENDLELHVQNAPASSLGIFLLANMSNNFPLGGGILCLQGSVIRLPVQSVSPEGSAVQAVDIPTLPNVGGGVVAGSTWFAQFAYRDLPSAGAFNYSNASQLVFE